MEVIALRIRLLEEDILAFKMRTLRLVAKFGQSRSQAAAVVIASLAQAVAC